MKAPTALQRGMACLCCRKRKMKCDGARPVCAQCSKANRSSECQYYEKKRTSRTQLLQAKITKLEARLRELEAEHSSPDSSSSGSQSPQTDRASLAYHQRDLGLGFDASVYSTPELDHDFLLGAGDAFLDDESFSLGFAASSSSSSSPNVAGWSSDGMHYGPPVDDFLVPGPSNASMSRLPGPSAGPSSRWWESDVFCENKQILLDIFFAHRHQCAFEVHIGRFKAALLLPNAQKPHPSLVDAIYLLACYFSRSPLYTGLESYFLKESLRAISDALQSSDRIVHVLQASCLLALYFFWHGRTLEGYYHSSIAARLAVGLGLHQIRPDQFSRAGIQGDVPAPLNASVPLSPPRDEVEYTERIAAFWQIFAVDRAWAVVTGLPTALPDDDHPRSVIKTMWPIPIPNDPEPPLNTVQPFANIHLSESSPICRLRVEVIELYERTARLSAAKEDCRHALENSWTQFAHQLANVRSQEYIMTHVIHGADMIGMQTAFYAATIHLYRDTLELQRQSYDKCLMAANAISTLITQLTDSDYDYMYPIISGIWRDTADVYLRVLAMHQSESMPTNPQIIEQQLDGIVSAMQRLGCLFPIAGIHASKVQEDRAAARQPFLPSVM